MRNSILLMILCACTSENTISSIEKIPTSAEDTSPPPEEFEEIIEEPVLETCPDRIFSGGTASINEDCLIEPPNIEYTPVIEWTIDSFEEYPELVEIAVTPVVGNMTDDNADGVIGEGDIPDIAVVSSFLNHQAGYNSDQRTALRLISGDGSQVHWSLINVEWEGALYEPIQGGTPALGDVDLDGEPEIVVVLAPLLDNYEASGTWIGRRGHSKQEDCHVAVFSGDGVLEQLNTENPVICMGHSPALADMEGDGIPDIAAGNRIFEGTTLAPKTTFTHSIYYGYGRNESYWNGPIPVVADLEGDGLMEMVSGRHIQEWDGTMRCLTGVVDGYPAVADIDMDGNGEIVITTDGLVFIYDHNCSLIDAWENEDGGRGGPPTIADYNGDGLPEIGFPSRSYYSTYQMDGTLLWRSPVNDMSSNCTGSSVFDFEDDGYAEVVYADEEDLWIISGQSGDLVMRSTYHDSWTANEYPLVADVDGDNEAEILVAHMHGIYAVSALEGWAPARQVWNQHAYSITNINDDLSIPSPAQSNWPEYNNFRSGDLRENNGQGAKLVDAFPIELNICEIECEQNRVEIAISVGNQGLADASNGIDIAVYTEIEEGDVLLQIIPAEYMIRSGYSSEGYVLELDLNDIPSRNVIISVDDDGTGAGRIDECNEENNRYIIDNICAN